MKASTQPPRSVPVLTEVVVLPNKAPEVVERYPDIAADPAYAATAPAPLHDSPPAPPMFQPMLLDESALAQRVLADLDKQLDLMFEHRLRESLTPVLARMTDSLVREMRNQLAASMREMVSRAVSIELDKLHRR